jgi:hypothetical protein
MRLYMAMAAEGRLGPELGMTTVFSNNFPIALTIGLDCTSRMASIEDINALILLAKAKEARDPTAAQGQYELAERQLEEFLAENYGASRQLLDDNPDSVLTERFLFYFMVIDEGYLRLNPPQE